MFSLVHPASRRAIAHADDTVDTVLTKVRFWCHWGQTAMNARRITMCNRLLDGSSGKLTTRERAVITTCSQDTALRDINESSTWALYSGRAPVSAVRPTSWFSHDAREQSLPTSPGLDTPCRSCVKISGTRSASFTLRCNNEPDIDGVSDRTTTNRIEQRGL
ncbi:hypothetical protein AB0C34_23425 [Nocardia sp. NPDC049220]|uniref:hypothetical protein n=1 Tax=Nocardia sp. NPDC049220 TaxID=3155273 RepID=UPI0033DDACD5